MLNWVYKRYTTNLLVCQAQLMKQKLKLSFYELAHFLGVLGPVVLMFKNVISHHVVVKCDIFRTETVASKGLLHIDFNSCEA